MKKQKTIVIVDDEVELSEFARMVLAEKGGYEVGICNQSERAIGMIREWKPDLVLLDIMMPNVDGTEIAARLREDPELCAIPVIFLTSLMTAQEAATHPVIGKNRFLPKPINGEELLKRIREFFELEV
ncbi:MAG: Transcriptional regulatory protein YycF [Candidatus Omnitrophica bacterium ADurb.Bin277]|nr:MAG: Transcriptional regulatory protein YycF [Candidatus Omnitrophica bacterium ADurb.Bin277]